MENYIFDNHYFIQKLQVINGYRINTYIESFKRFDGEKNPTTEVIFTDNDDNELPDFGFIDKKQHEKFLKINGLTNTIKYLSKHDIRMGQFPVYSFFDYMDHKLIFVNAYTRKIISKS